MKNKEKNTNNIKNKKKSPFIQIIIILLFISLLLSLITLNINDINKTKDIEIWVNKLEEKFLNWLYSEIIIDWNKAIATLSWQFLIEQTSWVKTQLRDITIVPNNYSLKDLWLKNPSIKTDLRIKDKTSSKFWADMIPTIITFILFIIIAFVIIWRMWWMANNAMTFWKSRARLYDKDKDKVDFNSVAWAEEEKEELSELVDFLKNPKKYKDMGAKIPRWILLVWAPWTWKTLLARAVAWESNVPFMSISWSEFVEMFVWVWASRVRDLFNNAKKIAPAIIFIDEIDAIGKKRWPGTWWGHDEREQTLNQILTEMDWFDNDTNIIVIWATNRADVLDKALLRPGRFDRKITVNLPNVIDREEILKVHSKNKIIWKDVNFKEIASKTVWFSWADIDNLINESAIITARKNEKEISSNIITEAFERIVMWLRKKSQIMNQEEKKITAYHEVWHAIVWKLLPNSDPVHKISIISRWWALWVTWFLPEKDKLLVSKAKLLDEISILYGWRAAEEIFFGKENITSWASNDIERATKIARSMVMRYWMYEDIWAENFEWESVNWNHLWVIAGERPYISDETIKKIDEKVKNILKEAYEKSIYIINQNKEKHKLIANKLLEKEEISKDEFEEFFKN